jgi:thiol-disulfide isomerase/thioredoxin
MRPPRQILGTIAVASLMVSTQGCAAIRHLRPPPAGARQHLLSVRGLPSGDPLIEGSSLLEELTGVYRADSNLVRGEIKVWTRAEVDTSVLVAALVGRGMDAVGRGGEGTFLPPPGFSLTADARIITSRGEDIDDLAPFAVPGKVTVFDFYADWCGPCHVLDEQLRQIAAAHTDLAIRKLNIVDFDSLLAKHFASRGIPFLVVFNRAGHRFTELRGNDPRWIVQALGKASVSND